MRTFIAAAALAIAAGCAETGLVAKDGATAGRLPQLEEKIRAMIDENMTAGMSVVVVKGDKVIYQQAFGYRDKDTREPLDIDDVRAESREVDDDAQERWRRAERQPHHI